MQLEANRFVCRLCGGFHVIPFTEHKNEMVHEICSGCQARESTKSPTFEEFEMAIQEALTISEYPFGHEEPLNAMRFAIQKLPAKYPQETKAHVGRLLRMLLIFATQEGIDLDKMARRELAYLNVAIKEVRHNHDR